MLTRRLSRSVLAPVFVDPSAAVGELAAVSGLVESFFGPSAFPIAATPRPALNIGETEHAFIVQTEVPGFRMEDIEITLHADTLTLRGKRPDTTSSSRDEQANVLRSERSTPQAFARSLSIGTPIDAARVSASLELGVLTITLPKAEAAKPRTIPITLAPSSTTGTANPQA